VADDRLGVPPELRARIADDLTRVEPLEPPMQRAIGLVPVAIVLLVAAVLIFGLRRDAGRLGPMLTWGASTLQMLLGLVLVAMALREAVPGTTIARRTIGVVLGTALIAVLTITFLTWTWSPTTIRQGFEIYVWSVCLTGTVLSALPALALAGWLAARAFPLRPHVAGALYGLGAGLMADGGWRLFCHFSDPVHVLGSHTIGIVLTGVLGVMWAVWIGRR
jgi:hypothetical protein